MYYVVHVLTWRWRDRLRRFVDDWLKNIKYRLPKEVREQVVTEKWVGPHWYVILIRESLAGLWVVRRLEVLADKHGVPISVYEAKIVSPDEKYIDEKLREKIEHIPPHLVHDIRKALIEGKLPRGKKRKEIIETMKY